MKQRKPEQIPDVPLEIVEYLDRVFPNSVPTLEMSDREVWASVGARTVVDHLRAIVARQEKSNVYVRPGGPASG